MGRILAAFVTICCASQAFAQWRGESDTSERLIKLNVAATDAKGAPVTDLRPTDIQVREDGVLRPVVFFRFTGSKRLTVPSGPGEFINRPVAPPTIILLDRWNQRMMTMASAWDDISGALAHLESVDQVYIYFLTSHGDLFPVRPLPGAGADLRLADSPTSTELVSKLNDAVRTLNGFRDIDAHKLDARVNTTMDAFSVILRTAPMAGRKNLIWVTHGFPLEGELPSRAWGDFTPAARNLVRAAARLQVAIYTVDQSGQGAGADMAGLARQTLRMFSGLTGGRWYSSGGTADAIDGATGDARGNYRLAYCSSVRERGWKEHKIQVESQRKDIRLLTRQSYFGIETQPDPDRAARAAFDNQSHCPFDATEIALRVAVSKPAAASVHFDIHVDPKDLLLEHRGERFQGSLAATSVLYSKGVAQRALAPIQKDLDFTQEQWNAALKDGIVIPQDVPLGDDTQQVRAMVFDRGLRGAGSVTIPIR